jgi:hypothetical protein
VFERLENGSFLAVSLGRHKVSAAEVSESEVWSLFFCDEELEQVLHGKLQNTG